MDRKKFKEDLNIEEFDEKIREKISQGVARGFEERNKEKKSGMMKYTAAILGVLIICSISLNIPVIADIPIVKKIISAVSGATWMEEAVDGERGDELSAVYEDDNIEIKVLYGVRDKNSIDLVLSIKDGSGEKKKGVTEVVGIKDLKVFDNNNEVIFEDTFKNWNAQGEDFSGILKLEGVGWKDVNCNDLEGDISITGELGTYDFSQEKFVKIADITKLVVPIGVIKENKSVEYQTNKQIYSGDKMIDFQGVELNASDSKFLFGIDKKTGCMTKLKFDVMDSDKNVVSNQKSRGVRETMRFTESDRAELEQFMGPMNLIQGEEYSLENIELIYDYHDHIIDFQYSDSKFDDYDIISIEDIKFEKEYVTITVKAFEKGKVGIWNYIKVGREYQDEIYKEPKKIEAGFEIIPEYSDERMRKKDYREFKGKGFRRFDKLTIKLDMELYEEYREDNIIIPVVQEQEIYKFEDIKFIAE